ncbi:MAG: lysophospholipid acyltransferase family protein [Planctomycetota bacterium]
MLKFSPRTREFFRKQRPPKAFWRLSALLGIQSLNAWMASLNYRMFRYEKSADPADRDFFGPAIYVFWHEFIPFPVYTRPSCNLAMLLSKHQDAEILSHIAGFAGLGTVRGSTNKGGTSALRELMEKGRGCNLAITPDGPRGPRRRLAQGCIYVASRLQVPIIPLGIGYDRPWRNKRSWDQFAIPRPFSRCRAVLGPRLYVPEGLDRDGIEKHRQWIESQLTLVTEHAERWAEQNFHVVGSEPLFRTTPDSQQSNVDENGCNKLETHRRQFESAHCGKPLDLRSSDASQHGFKIAG